MNLKQRLIALEARPRESLGWRTFHTSDGGQTYYEDERAPARFDVSGMGGPETERPDARTYTEAELDEIQRQGWNVLVTEYKDLSPQWWKDAQADPALQDAQGKAF